MVTSRDVAELAGVSQATVSRVITPGRIVSPAVRTRVIAAMHELGYVPHSAAKAMRTRRTKTIGLVVADLRNPFYTGLLDAVTTAVDRAGYRVVLWDTDSSDHRDAIRAIREAAIDGLVFTTATTDTFELTAAAEAQQPIVLINRDVPGIVCDTIVSDNVNGGRAIADYVVQHGRTAAAFIGGVAQASTSQDRARGFLERMSELGAPVAADWIGEGQFSHKLAARITRDWMALAAPPRVIVCANDYMAFGALDALCALGVSAKDCWVIGYDDVDMASWESFSLTTMHQPSREMAAQGIAMLLERIESPSLPPRRKVYPSTLVIRGSTP